MAFAVLALVLALSILYSRAMRRVHVAGDLQFVPKENELVVVTGELEGLWEAVDRHFGEVLRAGGDEESGGLTGLFAEIREYLDEQGVPVGELADLTRYGLDVSRAAIASLERIPSEAGPLAVARVVDEDAFTSFFAALTGLERDVGLRAIGGVPVVSFGDDEAALAFPRADVATMVLEPGGPLLLERSLAGGSANRTHALQDDALYEGVRRRLGGPLGTGPALYAYWRPRAVPPLEDVVAVARFGEEEIGIEIDAKVDSGGLRVLDDLLDASNPAADWHARLPSDAAAVIVLEDAASTDYLRSAAMFEELEEPMERSYAGVLGELRRVPSLRCVLFAWTGYRDGLPEWIVGAWADPVELGRAVDELKIRNREDRDRTILEGAIEAYRIEARDDVPTIADLFEAGLLVEEPYALFDRYPIVELPPLETANEDRAEVLVEPGAPQLAAEDLDNPAYVLERAGLTLEYLLPPITANDLRYVDELEELDPEVASRDEYRLATLILGDTLWIASDAGELEALAGRSPGSPGSLVESTAFRTASSVWGAKAKIRGFVDVDRLTVLGLLSPESEIEEQVKAWLLDLRNHPVVAFGVDSGGDRRLFLSVRLFRRPALVSR
jgi:hypothetical protein